MPLVWGQPGLVLPAPKEGGKSQPGRRKPEARGGADTGYLQRLWVSARNQSLAKVWRKDQPQTGEALTEKMGIELETLATEKTTDQCQRPPPRPEQLIGW